MRPIQAGDVCLVVAGLGRGKSPNLGLTVTVGRRIYGAHGGDHSQYGPVHHCEGAGVSQLSDTGSYFVASWAHFPVAWLQRIEPPALDQATTESAELSSWPVGASTSTGVT